MTTVTKVFTNNSELDIIPAGCNHLYGRILQELHIIPIKLPTTGPMSLPRGYPSPRFFPRSLVPGPSQRLSSPRQGVLQCKLGGSPVPGEDTTQAGWVYLLVRTELGYCPGQDRTGVPPSQSGQDWGIPTPSQEKTGVHPGRTGLGYPPRPGYNWTSYTAAGMPLSVSSRTFMCFL